MAIFWKYIHIHIHIDKKNFCQKKIPYNFVHNPVPRDIHHILDYANINPN